MDEDKAKVIRRWMKGRVVINPSTFESVLRHNGKTIPVDPLFPDSQLWDLMKEDLWELCQ